MKCEVCGKSCQHKYCQKHNPAQKTLNDEGDKDVRKTKERSRKQ